MVSSDPLESEVRTLLAKSLSELQIRVTSSTSHRQPTRSFGRSAGGRLVHRVEGEVIAAGHRAALNTPYPGGYILSRQGRPHEHIHAIQIEIDLRLYLDAGLTTLGEGLTSTALLLPDDRRRRRRIARRRAGARGGVSGSAPPADRRSRPPIKKPPRANARGGQGSGRRHARKRACTTSRKGGHEAVRRQHRSMRLPFQDIGRNVLNQ